MADWISQACASLLLAASFVAAGSAGAEQNRSSVDIAAGRAAPANAAGQPVRGDDGAPINYGPAELRAAAPAAAGTAAPRQETLATPATADWSYVALGSGIGLSGILTAVNGQRVEIYAGGSGSMFGGNEYWYALRYAPGTEAFQPIYVSERFTQGIRRLALARVAGRASPLIVVALSDGGIRLHDQATKEAVASFSDPCSSHGGLQDLQTADLNGDGTDEFVSSCYDQALFAYGSGYTPWMLAAVAGADVVTGQMDDDPAIEIATAGGAVVDADTHTVQWQWQNAFGVHLQAADVDGDGRDELIAAESWYIVWAYDVERKLPRWSIPSDLDIGAILVTDVDGDGVHELLLGDGQWGEIHAYNTVTQAEEWSIHNPEHGVSGIAVADVDFDGVLDVLWGAGASSSGSDHLYVADWQTQTIVAQTEHLDGPFVGPRVGDLDGDGIAELVAVSSSSDSGYSSGRIVVVDSRTLAVRAISPGVGGGWSGAVKDVELRDLNADGQLEVLVAMGNPYDGLIEAYAFSASNQFSLVWTNATRPFGLAFHAVDVADIDGDGNLEVLAAGGREHTGAEGVYIYAYDAASGAEEWHTLQIGDYWSAVTDLVIADTDADGDTDLVGMVEGGDVYVFDGATHLLEALVFVDAASLGTRGSGTGLQTDDRQHRGPHDPARLRRRRLSGGPGHEPRHRGARRAARHRHRIALGGLRGEAGTLQRRRHDPGDRQLRHRLRQRAGHRARQAVGVQRWELRRARVPHPALAAARILGDEAMRWAVLRNAPGEDPVSAPFVA